VVALSRQLVTGVTVTRRDITWTPQGRHALPRYRLVTQRDTGLSYAGGQGGVRTGHRTDGHLLRERDVCPPCPVSPFLKDLDRTDQTMSAVSVLSVLSGHPRRMKEGWERSCQPLLVGFLSFDFAPAIGLVPRTPVTSPPKITAGICTSIFLRRIRGRSTAPFRAKIDEISDFPKPQLRRKTAIGTN